MIWPMSRRMKFISRTTMATILIEEIDSAVARKSAVTRRACGLGRIASGSISPSAKPQMNGSTTPAAATVIAARPTRRTSRRSVSMPVSSSNIRMPSCETASSMLFCAAVCGKSACCKSGQIRPNTEGPSSSPPSSCPMTAGWPIRCISSPRPRPTSSRTPRSAKKIAADRPGIFPSAANAIETAPSRNTAAITPRDTIAARPRCRRLLDSWAVACVRRSTPRMVRRFPFCGRYAFSVGLAVNSASVGQRSWVSGTIMRIEKPSRV